MYLIIRCIYISTSCLYSTCHAIILAIFIFEKKPPAVCDHRASQWLTPPIVKNPSVKIPSAAGFFWHKIGAGVVLDKS